MIALLGNGGMAKELAWVSEICYHTNMPWINLDYEYVIGVGYPETKKAILDQLPDNIKISLPAIHFQTCFGKNVKIGKGSVICAFVSITADTTIGMFSSINNNVTIGHDCRIGDLFHASPGAVVSGNVTIGNRVFLGANSVIKEKINICDDVIIGAGAVVVKDITEPGKYAGNPVHKIFPSGWNHTRKL